MLSPVLQSHWKHLRLPFQLTLAPLFLLGWTLAGGARDVQSIAPAFIALHLLLYPGITAFNSWFDRDTGPVGGMERPPEIYPSLLPFSLIVQAVGLTIAAEVGLRFTAIYLVFMLLSVLYSHPRTRRSEE